MHPGKSRPGFYKDIIAGHVGTSAIAGNPHYHDIYWDGQSHYYCDGTVLTSGKIPVLIYDEGTGKYYSLGDDLPEAARTDENRYQIRGEMKILYF